MIRINEILDYLKEENINFQYTGDEDLIINDYSMPESIKPNSIIWIKNSNKVDELIIGDHKDILIVTSSNEDINLEKSNFIMSNNSKEVFFTIINKYFADTKREAFISPKSVVETNNIGKNVYIGHNCYIGPKVEISDDVTIKNNVVIEGKVIIGKGTTIFSGTVIGSDGYGYFKDENGMNKKVPHLGGVIIGNNVEIGANTCIDRGTLGNTVVGNNVKIDNLCHIAHNVVIEDNVNIIALSMIAGSVKLKENSYIAPSASIMNQLTVGKNSLVGLGAVVVKEVEDNVVVAGVPAKVIRKLED